MDCGGYIAKYILCLFNFVLFLAGAAILALGVWLNVDKNSFLSFVNTVNEDTLPQLADFSQPEVVTQVSYILMIVGAAIFLLSLLGYCGALSESRCLLGLFGFLLVVILILEVTALGLAYIYRDKAQDETKTFLRSTIRDYYTVDKEARDPATTMWNALMQQFSCCGIDNYTDFNLSPSFAETKMTVPYACCKLTQNRTLVDSTCPQTPTPINSNYETGCYQRVVSMLMAYMSYVIYAILGVVLVELLSTCLSFCLLC